MRKSTIWSPLTGGITAKPSSAGAFGGANDGEEEGGSDIKKS